MRLRTVKIESYKGYRSTPDLNFAPGFNVIVGQNNAGKTAMIEALSLAFGDNPFRSEETRPRPTLPFRAPSEVRISLAVDEGEVREMLLQNAGSYFTVPTRSTDQEARIRVDSAFRTASVINGECIAGAPQNFYLEALGPDPQTTEALFYGIDPTLGTWHVSNSSPQGPTYGQVLAGAIVQRIYRFRAERLNVGSRPFGSGSTLLQDASNLAEVLHTLQSSNPARFQRLCRLANIIFPDIVAITVPPTSTSDVGILLWNIDPSTERADLAISINDSGIGIGQVLAMLYVVLTAEYPQVIIIDEPQSFLHPGAVRKLFAIFRQEQEGHQHQFIVTTHSPDVITAAAPSNIFLVRKEGAESNVETIDPTKAQEMQAVLADVGARLSDVFGADNILWVEGQTEERCFPLIVTQLRGRSILGSKILGDLHTGDFEGKDAERVFRIYERLSQPGSLVPPAIGFIFDREGRNEQQIADLVRRGKGRIAFTTRRMFENYLLNSEALAHVLSELDQSRAEKVTPQLVVDWIDEHRMDQRHISGSADTEVADDENWIESVNGARLIYDLFGALSDHRVSYDKIEHGEMLTNWIVNNTPEQLEDLARLVEGFLPPDPML
jgi:predicted ATPase